MIYDQIKDVLNTSHEKVGGLHHRNVFHMGMLSVKQFVKNSNFTLK